MAAFPSALTLDMASVDSFEKKYAYPAGMSDDASLPATTTPSDAGSTHGESFSASADGEDSTGPVEFLLDISVDESEDEGQASPLSKSAKRRLRRRRQRDAILAAAKASSPSANHGTTSVARPDVVGLGLTLATPTAASTVPFPLSPCSPQGHYYCGMQVMSPLAGSAAPATPSTCVSTPTSLCHNINAGTVKVVSTSPCNGLVIRGDASCRSPTFSSVPSVMVSPQATPCPMGAFPVAAPPLVQDPVVQYMRMFVGSDVASTREDMAAKLGAAAPEVYED